MTVGPRQILFRDRAVVLVTGTREQLGSSLEILNLIAELRLAKVCPSSFLEMDSTEQAEWARESLARITPPPADAVATCILDTGVNRGHPLLEHSLHPDHVLTCFPASAPGDHDGHGTQMAGLALYGDLRDVLASAAAVQLRHRLESVKIIPSGGSNAPELYGAVTREAVGRVETASPNRSRAYLLSITTTDFRDRGQPSSWSGEIDQLAYGEEDSPKRLFFISAGNVALGNRHLYPDVNHTDGIHDPGQAWNALTVGAYTEKCLISSKSYDGWQPIALAGSLSPCSTTSLVWEHDWPIKPDIVMEGGNCARSPSRDAADVIEDLSLISTSRFSPGKLFVGSGDTSGAAALAARMGSTIHAQYPNYWPETVRGLIVHSAEWTPRMKSEFKTLKKGERLRARVRCYGYGVPDMDRALWCARNSLCLVAQAELHPYGRFGNDYRANDMHFYELPWPATQLEALGEDPVTMRVTLSYFIEPSPGRRGWNDRHRYMSHGLRFKLKLPTEKMSDFEKRINRLARMSGEKFEASEDKRRWGLGWQLRNRGSILSDWWTGTATDLASCGALAIFPVTGWWCERPHLNCWDKAARYSLIVSIKTPSIDTDIYTPVANSVRVASEISIVEE